MAYHHGDLRRALLRGAIELLAEGGPSHLTLRGAARRAGVSPAAPYRHFADKRELLAAVAEEGFLALSRAGADAIEAAGDDAVGAFRRLGLAYVRFAIENPAHYRVMFGPEIPDKLAYEGLGRAAKDSFRMLYERLEACASLGLFDREEIELRSVRAWALVHGLASLFIDGQLGPTDSGGRERFLGTVDAAFALDARTIAAQAVSKRTIGRV